jgi:tRNA 2-thiouridine synthesizing protein A
MDATTRFNAKALSLGGRRIPAEWTTRQPNMDQNTDKTRWQQIDADDDAFSRSLGEIESVTPDHEWDAGDMGCGELVFHLSIRLKPMRPGQLLKLTARDLGVPQDLPAWCRLTGHHLTYANHPIYLLRRRED